MCFKKQGLECSRWGVRPFTGREKKKAKVARPSEVQRPPSPVEKLRPRCPASAGPAAKPTTGGPWASTTIVPRASTSAGRGARFDPSTSPRRRSRGVHAIRPTWIPGPIVAAHKAPEEEGVAVASSQSSHGPSGPRELPYAPPIPNVVVHGTPRIPLPSPATRRRA